MISSFNTRYVVSQSGRNFSLLIPSGRVLRGTGGAAGFTVNGSFTTSDGVFWHDQVRAGQVNANRTARFDLTIYENASENPGYSSCQSRWTATLRLR